ncbi:MAG: pantoate--beta-alanine ligase [Flavobacterium sp.]|nr:pantoate--beta-alanine ligase [Flavobacterium sp.]
MLIFETKQTLNAHFSANSLRNFSIGFVPTMGALHDGHLSLIKTSLENNFTTVISIFVNPTQFNNPDDLNKYPKDLDSDIKKIKKISEKVIIFAPSVDEIYGNKLENAIFDFDDLDLVMEGKHRPGHYNGVATVVKKLFDIVTPKNAYFGEKDFQQLMIVKKMVEKLALPINVVCCSIFREPNGLAMSSRNERLTPKTRNDARIIYEILQEVQKMYSNPLIPIKKINDWVKRKFKTLDFLELEYFEIAEEENLRTCKRKTKFKNFRAFIAVNLNNVRLIDTVSLK